ncbi:MULTISPECIES: hypothetical protein [Bacillus]|uniref:Uncharacterized protein n=1 Tax=Bacillus cereus (strain 03BB102) TaxID=572264 RepID=A0A158RRC8_BACC3|nr:MULTISPECIES: hypothetical protein [Bacillus cereus group]ACO29826.1 conserved hypothetical protein [Bacillus cereus 03BB102]MDV6036693.1 hypothetical protein [Bacillus sp. SM-B1]EDX63032.1 conserved hypothetical protein [Bacillus cereus 03BB108]MCU5305840.1 hypothetical protein [Bacillus cereus]MCU9552509.1 hypothetical protein [Bacillus cereus]
MVGTHRCWCHGFCGKKFYNIASEQLGESGYGFEFHHKPIDS